MNETTVTTPEGVRLHVRVWKGGAGRPFLLVHGLASNARLWDGVAARLATLGHPVAALDQRGHGRSGKPDHGYDFPTLSEDLVSVLDDLGFDRPVVAGQSWGANVVLELARRRPELVHGVVCVDGGVIDLGRHLPCWESCLAELGPPPPPGVGLDRLESEIRDAHPDWREEAIAATLACYRAGPDGAAVPHLTAERHLAILRHLWQHRPSSLYPRLAVPVLLVMCDAGGDSWQREAKHRAVAEVQRTATTVGTEWFDAGHDVHAQRPDDIARLLHGATDDGVFA